MINEKQATLGEIINRVRRNKHISVEQLIHESKISRSTYTRLISNQGEPSLETLHLILSVLHLSFDEVEPVLVPVEMSVVKQAAQLEAKYGVRQCGPIDVEALAIDVEKYRVQNAVAKSQTSQMVSQLATFLLAKQRRNRKACEEHGRAIYNTIKKYKRWDEFETQMMLEVIPVLSDAQLVSFFPYLEARNQHIIETGSRAHDALKDNELFFAITVAAIERHSYVLLTALVDALKQRFVPGFSLQGSILLRFGEIVTALLDGKNDLAASVLERLIEYLLRLNAMNAARVDWLRTQTAALLTDQWQIMIHERLQQRIAAQQATHA